MQSFRGEAFVYKAIQSNHSAGIQTSQVPAKRTYRERQQRMCSGLELSQSRSRRCTKHKLRATRERLRELRGLIESEPVLLGSVQTQCG